MTRRVLIGEISHETNTFSPIATDIGRFGERNLLYGADILRRRAGTKTGVGGYIAAAAAATESGEPVELIASVAASAVPSGIVTAEAFEHLTSHLVASIEAAIKEPGGLDGVALCLHGAMVAEGYDDAEGEILRRVRAAAGPEVPVVITLDLHGNLKPETIEHVQCLFGYDTNPHVDGYERAVEAFEALVDIWAGKLRPVMRLTQTQMMPPTINMRTAEGPMVKLFERARRHESRPGVRNVSVFGGFPFADIEFAGTSIVALTDGQPELAQEICDDVAALAWSIRTEFLKEMWQPDDAIRRAMGAARGPVILADVADNMGGGGSGDTTALLQALLKHEAAGVGFAVIVDPESVEACVAAGPGARVALRLGGKTEPAHGQPVACEALVRAVTDGTFVNKGPMATGVTVSVGPTACVEIDGVTVIVTSQRSAPNDPEIFRHIGIDPAAERILVVKSRGHFRAAYEPFAAEILEVDCPGFASPNLKHFTYHKVRRPVWPLDEI